MVYYIFGGIYILVSLAFFIRWMIKKNQKRRQTLEEIERAEKDDPFFDTFYPHF